MSNKHTENPWQDRSKHHGHEPVPEASEPLHSGDEQIDEMLEEEIDDIDQATKTEDQTKTVHEQKLKEAKDQLLRAHAEIDNVRRRAEQDVAKAHKFAVEKLVTELLPVLDSMEQALQNKTDDNPVIQGVELTHQLLLKVLEKSRVKLIDPLGEVFNPKEHEAISIQPGSGKAPNTVLAVVQKGYLLNDRLIRPARVVVAQ